LGGLPRIGGRGCGAQRRPGRIAAVDNGNAATIEPFQTDQRKAFNGFCMLIVRSNRAQEQLDDSPIALIANYSMHGTALGPGTAGSYEAVEIQASLIPRVPGNKHTTGKRLEGSALCR